MDFTPPFGQWLKTQRARLDLTQGDLARRVGYSPETIRKIEAGVLKPSKQIIDLLADHVGVPANQRNAFLAFATGARVSMNGKAVVLGNLPHPLTSFIGREADVVAVVNLLKGKDVRLVTLTGPGGVGKTRLAIESARTWQSHFPDGVWWVELAPVTEPQVVLNNIARALEIEDRPGKPMLRVLQDHLRDKLVLIVLDNLEQVLEAAPLIAQVLSVAPKVRALATSREALNIAGEQQFGVSPLTDDARELFVQRAKAVRPDFSPDATTREVIAKICGRVDGLPLAIELAAARIGLFTPKEMLARLDQRLPLLTGGGRDLPTRQRTLRATLDWSYDLLTPDEQALFRRLGVFAGGFTLHAVTTFLEINHDLALTAEDGLAALVSKNLLVRRESDKGESRYAMLETMREFALEKLKERDEFDVWMECLVLYLEALNTDENFLRWKPLEADNWRTAMTWVQHTVDKADLGLRLVRLTGQFVRNRESALWIEKVLAHPQTDAFPLARAEALFVLGFIQRILGDLKQAHNQLGQSFALCREHNFRSFMDGVLQELGIVAREAGDVERARNYLLEGLTVSHELEHDLRSAEICISLAEVEVIAENAPEARRLLIKSLEIARTRLDGNPVVIGWATNHLGHATLLEGNLADAKVWIAQSMQAFESLGPDRHGECDFGLAWGHHCFGEIALTEGDAESALRNFRQAISLTLEVSDILCVSWCLSGLAGAAALDEEPERGARLWGAGEGLRESIGCRIAPASRLNRERTVALLREQLGEAEFARLTAEGAKMDIDEAVAFALDEVHVQ